MHLPVHTSGRRLGWKPDRPKKLGEKPDLSASAVLTGVSVPSEASEVRLIAEILDQGALGSCTANAGFQAIRGSHVQQLAAARIKEGMEESDAYFRARRLSVLGSRLFGYYFERAFEHTTGWDSGGYLRDFFRACNRFGFPPEELWPYSDDLEGPFTRLPSQRAIQAAYDQRSPTVYRRITSDGYERVDDIKRAIAAGYLVCFGTDVDDDFCNDEFDPEHPISPPGQNIAGGHAMVVAGYRGDSFLIPNSWGLDWGMFGWCNFSADYMAHPMTRDLWIVEHAPRYSA